jgi:hypothetical protein
MLYPCPRVHYQISVKSTNEVSHINFQSIPVATVKSLPLKEKQKMQIFRHFSLFLVLLTCGAALVNQNVAPEERTKNEKFMHENASSTEIYFI